MGIIKTLDMKIAIKLRGIYGKFFNPSQPQFTINCEKNKEVIQKMIYERIVGGQPLMVARMGRTEIDVCENVKYTYYKHRSNWKFISWKGQPNFLNPFLIPNFNKLSGFWPWDDETALKRFYQLICSDMKEVDVLGSWCRNEEDFSEELKKSIKVDRELMTPLLTDKPWTMALKGKKVLVVHPFAETIQNQYARREKLFPINPYILPEFELKVLKAIQTLGYEDPNFKDWFEALDFMKKEIDKVDYDVCLLGCCAYGFPLAAHCKRKGKQAIHLGGILQLLFGIKGKRWETDPGYINDFPYASTYYNEYWVRASAMETPQKANDVENGCYW